MRNKLNKIIVGQRVIVLWSLVAFCVAPIAGCGSGNMPTVPVGGIVTFGGKQPPAAGTIYFAPTESTAGGLRRPGRANFSTDGRFTVTSFQPSDGLLPGTYRVHMECWKVKPKGTQSPGVSFVQAGHELPDLVVDSKLSESIELAYDLPQDNS